MSGLFSFLPDYYINRGKIISRDENIKKQNKKSSLKARYRNIKNKIPIEGQNRIEDELVKIDKMNKSDSSYSVYRNFIDFVLSIFELEEIEENRDIRKIRYVLDKDHYGLSNIKKIIIEYVAAKILNPERKAPVLCFVGPPGCGKTSLGISIAKALNRKFCRWSVGGITREAEIRGHRSTYVGALPGRILQSMKDLGVCNPLFMLDEIDKIGGAGSFNDGDPVSALLEVLDPEQNFSFSDNYVGVPVDLSKVFFITTANSIDRIPNPLRDRMEVINLPGYIKDEKIKIAERFLIPKQIKLNGLDKVLNLDIPTKTIAQLIELYTREAGVRNLERSIEKICRVLAVGVVEGQHNNERISISPNNLEKFLGQQVYFPDKFEKSKIGVSVGLAWTINGGRILFIESKFRGKAEKPKILLTGKLGDVMKESAQIALSFLNKENKDKAPGSNGFIHLHVPAGATPKDGPSAGLAILFCFYSLFWKKPIKEGLAVTGEITLRGKVLQVGGVKEKVIGAATAGVKEIILPMKNKNDLIGLPREIIEKIKFHFVKDMKEALKIAFD